MGPSITGGGGTASHAPTYKWGKTETLRALHRVTYSYTRYMQSVLMKEGPVEGPEAFRRA